jgi:hypothetical protein
MVMSTHGRVYGRAYKHLMLAEPALLALALQLMSAELIPSCEWAVMSKECQ